MELAGIATKKDDIVFGLGHDYVPFSCSTGYIGSGFLASRLYKGENVT